MLSQQTHKMQLEATHPSGAEEWACPECGRRFVAQWEPKFRRVILQEGQEGIIHMGQGMKNLEMSAHTSDGENSAKDSDLPDVWKNWLNTLDFDLDDDNA